MATAILTGATKGIGAGIATALARAGFDIVAVARSSADLEALAPAIEEHGVRFTAEPTDLAEPAEVEALAARILATDDELRVLVNNAGAGIGAASLLETSGDELRRILRLNVVAPYLLVRALAPRLAASGGGRVVNIGSAVGTYRIPPYTTSAAYSAAKGALGGLTRQAGRLLAARAWRSTRCSPATC